MKKKILAVLVALLCFASVLAGCGSTNWSKNVTLKDHGEVVATTNGGFAVETKNYVYFINGSTDYTNNNKFGTPVKGALAVAEKGKTETAQIVVPKLMTAGYYSAGVYVFGEYVYYVTPTTEKNNSGAIANNFLDVCRTKLDGSETKTFTRVNGNSTAYKFSCENDVVYFTYYNSEDAEIVAYNTKTDKSVKIAEEVTSYFFSTDTANANVVYTKAVKDATDEERTMAYNQVYTASATSEEKLVLDGTPRKAGTEGYLQGATYTLISYTGEYILYSVAEVNVTDYTKYYVSTFENIGTTDTKISQSSVMTTFALVVSENEFVVGETVNEVEIIAKYVFDGETFEKTLISADVCAHNMKLVDGYIYYTNDDSKLCRVEYKENAEEEVITKDAINTSWYGIEVYEVEGKTHVMVNNAGSKGLNYVFDVEISAENLVEVEDEDGEKTGETYYEAKLMGVMNDEDTASVFATVAGEKLPTANFDIDEESEDYKAYKEVKASYDALTGAQKKLVGESTVALMTNIEQAVELTKKMNTMLETYSADKITETNLEEAKKVVDDMLKEYDNAKSAVQSLVMTDTLNNVKKAWDKVVELKK